MSAVVKVVGAIVLLVALILAGLAIYLVTIFDPNDYKDEIQQLVKRQTDLDLRINGDLSLSVFPWLGVEVNQLTLASDSGTFAEVGQAQLSAKTIPLFSGRVEVSGVTFKNLNLNLEVDANGRANWETASSGQTPATPAANRPNANAAAPAAAFSLAALSVDQLAIEDSAIQYRNLQEESFHALDEIDFRISGISLTDSFPLSSNFHYRNQPQAQAIPISITGTLTPKLDEEGLDLNKLVIDLAQTRIAGDLTARNLVAAAKVTGSLRISELNPKQWAALLDQPALAGIDLPIALTTNLDFDQAQDRLELRDIKLSAGQLQGTASLSASQLSSELAYQGNLDLNLENIKAFAARLGAGDIVTSDKVALQRLSLGAQLRGSADAMEITGLNLKLDETSLTGTLSLRDFANPRISYNLSGDRLDLDRYMPPAAADGTQPEVSSEEAALLPVAAMRDLNMNGNLALQQLIVSKLVIDNLRFQADSNNGLINLRNLAGDAYEGNFKVTGTVDARTDTPSIAINQQMTGVNAAPVLQNLAQIDYISGIMDLNANLRTVGNLKPQLLANLNGTINFTVMDGVLSGMDMDRMICEGIARIRQAQLSTQAQQPATTEFQQLRGNLAITNGVVTTPELNLALNNITATGAGTINLVEQNIDYGIRVKLTGDLEDAACSVNERFRDIQWPIRCQGSLEQSPGDYCGIDSAEMTRIATRLARDELLRDQNIEEKLKENLGEDLGNRLLDIIRR